jgi:hypothetical protein
MRTLTCRLTPVFPMRAKGKLSMSRTKKIISEVVQFVPIITLASSFIVKGGVDVNQTGTLFVISGFCALVITGILVFSKVMLNPILLATNLWLLAGAAAFGIPLPALADIMSQTNAVLLFAAALVVGQPHRIYRHGRCG